MKLVAHFRRNYYRYQNYLAAVVILIATVLMAVTYWQNSEKFGIGINSDSIAYIRSAENLSQGNGLGRVSGLGTFKPMTHWPPLYSLILAAGNSLGSDIYEAARLIGLILNIFLVVLVGIILFKLCKSSIITAFGLAIFIFALPFWETTFRIMSEPLFLVLFLTALLALDRYYSLPENKWLITSAICMALSFLTRYTAIVFIATAILLLLLNANGSKIHRIKLISIYGLISCIPIGIWILINQGLTGSATNRVLQFFPIDPKDWDQLWINLSAWIAPMQSIFNIGSGKIIVACILFGIFLLTQKLIKQDTPFASGTNSSLAFYFIYLIPAYAVFILISRFYFDSMIQIYRERIIFPIFLAGFLLVFYAVSRLFTVVRNKSIWINGVLIFLFTFCGVSFFQGYKMETSKFLNQAKSDGIGFAGVRKNPPVLIKKYLAMPPADIKLSNNIELFYLLTGQDALTLSDDFAQEDIDRLNRYLQDRSATYVVFNARKIEKHLVELNPDVSLIYQDSEGGIYRYH